MAFDAAKARQAMESEFAFGPSGGGQLLLSVDDETGALALTITDREKREVEATVWVPGGEASNLHVWFTAALAADEWGGDEDGPDMYDTTDLVYEGELAATFSNEDPEHPFMIEAIDHDETEGGDASVLLSLAEAREFYPLFTVVLLAMGALV
jgi:hypothetical protein